MKYLSLLIIVTLFVTSCKKNDDTVIPSFVKTEIPSTINTLFESKGDANSDTVWVYAQGGPTTEREYTFEDVYDDGSDVYPFITDDFRVYPFQVQHLNPKVTTATNFTFENAKIESATNAEIVKEIVEHFTSQNKVVYLVGHSYGSFVVNEVLATYGSIARKTISLNGRLDMDKPVWEAFSRGEEWLFDADGVNPTLNSSASMTIADKNLRKLAAGLGFNRYTKRFVGVDLSDAIFVSSGKDEFVGDFTLEALDFLTTHAELNLLLSDFGHGDIFHPSLFEQLHNEIIKDN